MLLKLPLGVGGPSTKVNKTPDAGNPSSIHKHLFHIICSVYWINWHLLNLARLIFLAQYKFHRSGAFQS